MTGFNPFENRLCRDIRNRLSEAFLKTLETHTLAPLERSLTHLKNAAVEPAQTTYIRHRLDAYSRVLNQPASALNHIYTTARLLWDADLFFECHEWLEPFWLDSEKPQKKVIQALIRAAGFYVLLEGGQEKGAGKMAAKAAALISDTRSQIPPGLKPDLLLEKMRTQDPCPPVLGIKLYTRPLTNNLNPY